MVIRAVNPSSIATTAIMVNGVNIGDAGTGHSTYGSARAVSVANDIIVFTAPMEVFELLNAPHNLTLTVDDSSWFGANTINRHAYGAGARASIGGGATVNASAGAIFKVERLQIKNTDASSDLATLTTSGSIEFRACTLHNENGGSIADIQSGHGAVFTHCFLEVGANANGIKQQTGATALDVIANTGLRNSATSGSIYEGVVGHEMLCHGLYGGNANGVTNSNPIYVNCIAITPNGFGECGSSLADAPGTIVYNNATASGIFMNTNVGNYDVGFKTQDLADFYATDYTTVFIVITRDIDEDDFGIDKSRSMGADYYVAPAGPAPAAPNLFNMSVPDGSDEFLTLDGMITVAKVDGGSPTQFAVPGPSFTVSPAKDAPAHSLVAPVGLADSNLWSGQTFASNYLTLDGMQIQHRIDGAPIADFIAPEPTYNVPDEGIKAGPAHSLVAPAADPTRDNWLVPDMLNDPDVIESWTEVAESELRLAAMDFMVPLNAPKFIPEGGADGTAEVIFISPLLTVTFDAPAIVPDMLIQTNTQVLGDVIARSDLGLLNTIPLLVYGIDILSTADLDAQFVPNGLRFLVDASFSAGPGDTLYDAGARASYIGVRTANGMVFREPADLEIALYVKVTVDLMGQGIQPGTAVPIGFKKFESRSFPVWHPYKPMPEKALEAQSVYQMLDPDEIYRYYSLLASEMYIIWQDINNELRLLLSPEEANADWLDLLAEQYSIPLDQTKGEDQQRQEIAEYLRIPKIRGTATSAIVPTRSLNYRVSVFEIWADPEDVTNWTDKATAPAPIQAHMMAVGIYDAQVTESGQKGIDFVVVPHGFFHDIPAQSANYYPTGRLAVILSDFNHQPIPFSSLSPSEQVTLRDEVVESLNHIIPAHADVRLFAEGIEVSPANPLTDAPHEEGEASDSLATTDVLFIINPTPVLTATFVIT